MHAGVFSALCRMVNKRFEFLVFVSSNDEEPFRTPRSKRLSYTYLELSQYLT